MNITNFFSISIQLFDGLMDMEGHTFGGTPNWGFQNVHILCKKVKIPYYLCWESRGLM